MKAANLDLLEKHLPPPASRAILEAMDVELSDRFENLATKADLAADIGLVKAEIAVVRADLRALEQKLRGEIKDAVALGLKFWAAQILIMIGLQFFHR